MLQVNDGDISQTPIPKSDGTETATTNADNTSAEGKTDGTDQTTNTGKPTETTASEKSGNAELHGDDKVGGGSMPVHTFERRFLNEKMQEYRTSHPNASAYDIERMKKQGIKGIKSIKGADITDDAETLTIDTLYGEKTCAFKDAMLERCHVCKGKEHKIYDEIIGESKDTKDAERFAEVEKIEAMSPEEKFAFFQKELSKCIRCNACRNACPACSCRKCVFDSTKFDSQQKANVDSFEEKMFHIIRAFHVAGRCTDCGECSRVCPQGIPLHLFNRKFIKDINELYGEYQAGEEVVERGPLTSYTFEDAEPGIVAERG